MVHSGAEAGLALRGWIPAPRERFAHIDGRISDNPAQYVHRPPQCIPLSGLGRAELRPNQSSSTKPSLQQTRGCQLAAGRPPVKVIGVPAGL